MWISHNKNNRNDNNNNNYNNNNNRTWVKQKQPRFNSTYQSSRVFGGHHFNHQVRINTNLKLFARID